MARSNVITNIESKTKATSFLSFKSLLFFIGYLVVAYMFRVYVNSLIFIPYIIFSGIMCFIMLLPSKYNKGRNTLESICIMFKADKGNYRPYIQAAGDEGEVT